MNPLHDFKPEIKTFFIVAAVSVVLTVAGIFLLQGVVRNQVSHTPPVPSPQPQAINNQQLTIDTSTWQTYHNEEFGFEVKYPFDWGISGGTRISHIEGLAEFFTFRSNTKESRETFVINVEFVGGNLFESLDKLSSKEKATLGRDNQTFEKIEDLTIGGLPAIKYSVVGTTLVSPGEGENRVLLKKGNTLFDFVFSSSRTSEVIKNNERLFDRILSTFRFVERTKPNKCENSSESCWRDASMTANTEKDCEAILRLNYQSSCFARLGELKNDTDLCERAGTYGGYLCEISVAMATAKYSEAEAKAIIVDRATAVMRALKEKDMTVLASFVHPQKPLRFWSINASFEIPKEKIPSFFTDQTEYTGSYDGSGFPFTYTQAEYYESYIYDRDYLNAPDVNYKLSYYSSATTIGDQFERYHQEDPVTATYAFPQSSPDAAFDWRNLRLWFTQEDGVWYLREIMQNQWAI
ncbi:MAG TPA: hypothetical protein VGA53_04065 [Candidatus Paceibacterota bacterium]